MYNNDDTITIYDLASDTKLKTFGSFSGNVDSLAFLDSDNRLLSIETDGTIKLWNTSDGSLVATMTTFPDNEWITITPEGYFNASPNGAKHLNILLDPMTVTSIDSFYDTFYRPDLVKLKLQGEDITRYAKATIKESIKKLPPNISITNIEPSPSDPKKVKVCYKAESKDNGGIGEVRLFHNGKLFFSDGIYTSSVDLTESGKKIEDVDSKSLYNGITRALKIKSSDKVSSVSTSTALSQISTPNKPDTIEECKETYSVNGDNEYSALAFNSTNTISSELTSKSYYSNTPKVKPKLYIVSIGIDKFKDSTNNLKYASKDALDFINRLSKQTKTILDESSIKNISLTNEKATKANILSTIKSLSNDLLPEDRVVIFVASHGVVLDGSYYMVTNDYDGNIKESSLISSNEIVEMTKSLPSFNQILIIDTCHAGGMDNIMSGLYDSKVSVLAKKTGLHLFASANSKQEALDGYKENGLFTYTLLNGLNNNKEADVKNKGIVSVEDLGEFSKKLTNKISKELKHEQTPIILNFGSDMDIYRVMNK
jgi:hypothetical protein